LPNSSLRCDESDPSRPRPELTNRINGAAIVGTVNDWGNDHHALHVEPAVEKAKVGHRSRWRRIRCIGRERELSRVTEHVEVAVAGPRGHAEVHGSEAGLSDGAQRVTEPPVHRGSPTTQQGE